MTLQRCYLWTPTVSQYAAKADLTHGRWFLFVSRRYRHQVETSPLRWGWRLGRVANEPTNQFLPLATATPCVLFRFWLQMFVAPLLLTVGITIMQRLAYNAEARVDAVLLEGEQQLARSLQVTKPRLLERQQLREQHLRRQRQRQFTRDWQPALEALATLYQKSLADHAELAAGNAGSQRTYVEHHRTKCVGEVTTSGCFFSAQPARGHAAGCTRALAI